MNRTTFCRTCGRGGLVYSVPLVHQSEVTGQTVLHMLEYGVGLKLIDDGVFPPQICRLCYGQIVATYELKQTSIESQTCFLQWFPSETLVGVAENLPPDETEMRKEKIVQAEEPASPVDVPPRPEVESPMVDCSIPKDVVFTDNEVQEALISGIAAEIARRAKKAQRAYECKYCDFDTFDKLEYIAHYSVHPEAICCECGFVTNRKFSLRRHLANFRCNESDRFLSPRVRFKRTRTDRVSLESNNTFVDEALEQVRECLQPEEHTQELSNLERPNIEPEKLSLVASELVIESVKIEPEDASITQSIPKLNQQLPTLEHDEDSMEPHMYDSTELDGKIYICQYCPFATLLRKDYLLHYEDHPRVLRCVCGFLTDRAYTLRRHVEKTGCDHSKYSHSGKIYKCQYCSYISTSKSHYVRHWRTHPKNLRCLCGFTTDRKFSLRRHLTTAKCEEIYGKKVDWDDFNKRRTPAYVKNNKPFQLVWLGEGNPELAEEEPSDNNTTNGYKCSYCAHISKDRREYLSHSRTHPKNFQCLCGFETDRRFTFQRHLLKWGCEKAYGKRMDLGPRVSRKARKKAVHTKAQLDSALEAVSSESGATPFEGDIKLEEECLLPEGNTTEPAVHYAADTEGEDLPLSDSDIIIEAVKIEPEDASIFEDISKLSEEYSTPEIHTELISEDNTQKTQKIFTCTYCPFTTVVQTDYMLHYRGHPRVLRCVCGFMTDKQFTLQRHVAISGCNRTVNDELGRPRSSRHWKLFKCRYCSYSSTSRADYVMHWKCHPKVLRCLCGFTTDRKFSLVRHLGVVKCETTYGKKVDWEAYQRGARGWLRNRTPFDISWINVENHEIAIAPE